MKKFAVLMILGIMMVNTAVAASPYTVDGNLGDWGVTPFSDWSCDSPTCDMTEEDYDGTNPEPGNPYPTPYGGELYDIEAAYFDDYYDGVIGGWAYFAIVLSHPPKPNAYSTETGDIAIDLDNDPMTGEYGFEYGIKVQGPNKGQVCYLPDWHITVNGILANSPGTMSCDGPSSVVKGYADLAYVNAGIKDHPAGCLSGAGCLDNYIIEVGVKKTYLGLPAMGNISDLHMTQSCGNDLIEINDFDWDWPAPEFVSLAAALAILLTTPAFAYLLYKKRH